MSAPDPIQHTSDRVLEFDHLRELLAACMPLLRWDSSESPAWHPSRDRRWIERQQLLAEELRGYLRSGGRFDFHGLLDPTPLTQQVAHSGSGAGTHRNPRCAACLADRAAEWREIALHPPVAIEAKWEAVRELSQDIARLHADCCVTSTTRYCPTERSTIGLRPSCRAFAATSSGSDATIQQSLQSYLRRLSDGGAVQDELITIRGERFVIPVKVEQRRRVQGVAHGASSSGQTVFMEPLETIEQNNELVRLHDEEQGEIHRILLEMTARIGEHADALAAAVEILGELELQFAKARFAEDYDCVAVKLLGGAATR